MKDLLEKDLAEIKALLDASLAGQVEARNEFAQRLASLGLTHESLMKVDHFPLREGEILRVSIQSYYFEGKNKHTGGWFDIEVCWLMPHEHTEECDSDCEIEKDSFSRPATAKEVVMALRNELLKKLEEAELELVRDWELAKALPTEEELAKARRRVEDNLRKHPKDIPAVIKLLKFIHEE
ncbi:MAG: hypothetical protein V1804_03955 [Patescibacteria group bacterium]